MWNVYRYSNAQWLEYVTWAEISVTSGRRVTNISTNEAYRSCQPLKHVRLAWTRHIDKRYGPHKFLSCLAITYPSAWSVAWWFILRVVYDAISYDGIAVSVPIYVMAKVCQGLSVDVILGRIYDFYVNVLFIVFELERGVGRAYDVALVCVIADFLVDYCHTKMCFKLRYHYVHFLGRVLEVISSD